ncbi:AraC family transcriptional regulator [Mucilaginibacter sp. cycad4]|uniref:helix-turn-helix domain-containing protein n=1 Tax=Mucilaginibacter sp. cycad4 TaxID=3342096 RepID=UPI002AAB98DD|nr:AraC family transcriptional regulator [Mucilaginibacter gossypii]WPV02024.1 AraC family transcriptional regulator [Mucilaginibacter gossypii]
MKKTDVISEYHLNHHQPDKAQFAIYDLYDYVKRNMANTTRPHIHSYYQVIWFKAGHGNHFVDFQSYEVKDDSIFFVSKNQVHYFDNNSDYRGYLIHFNEPFLIQTDSEMEFFLKCNFFGNPYQSPVNYIGSNCHQILETYIKQIQAELNSTDSLGREELLRGYLKAFLIQVQRLKNGSDLTAFVNDEKRLQLLKFINLVDENYKKGLSVSEYAALMYISSRTLSDVTGQLIKKTPSQIIQERIILEAQRLLLHSELNINQVGYRLGFDDPSYFVKYFKKHTQLSPSDFRKSIS